MRRHVQVRKGGFPDSNRENRIPDFALLTRNRVEYKSFLKFPYVFPYGKPIGKTVFPVFLPPIIDRRRNGKTDLPIPAKGRINNPVGSDQ